MYHHIGAGIIFPGRFVKIKTILAHTFWKIKDELNKNWIMIGLAARKFYV
jgi:hypothetical protein